MGAATTLVRVEAWLSFVFGSSTALVNVMLLPSAPTLEGWTTMLTVALAPLLMVPRWQITTVEPLQLPLLEVAETRDAEVGRLSVIVTPVAAWGPLFETSTE